jgi:hypothetical protein
MLEQLLFTLDRELARWSVLEQGLDEAALARLFPHGSDRGRTLPLDASALDARMDEAAYRALWGGWVGRERELYRECAARVAALGSPRSGRTRCRRRRRSPPRRPGAVPDRRKCDTIRGRSAADGDRGGGPDGARRTPGAIGR